MFSLSDVPKWYYSIIRTRRLTWIGNCTEILFIHSFLTISRLPSNIDTSVALRWTFFFLKYYVIMYYVRFIVIDGPLPLPTPMRERREVTHLPHKCMCFVILKTFLNLRTWVCDDSGVDSHWAVELKSLAKRGDFAKLIVSNI